MVLDRLDQLRIDRPGVACQPIFIDSERREDQGFLLVGEIGEAATVEGCRVHVNVDAVSTTVNGFLPIVAFTIFG
jgi:hypothetical protein